MRNQFTFYRSFWEAIRGLNQRDKLSALEAICAYALDGKEPRMTPTAAGMFVLIKPVLDSAEKKSKGGKRMSSNAEDTDKTSASNAEDTDKTSASNAEDTRKEKEGEKEKEKEGEVEVEVEKENECYISSPHTAREAPEGFDRVLDVYERIITGAPASTRAICALLGYMNDLPPEIIIHGIELAAARDKKTWSFVDGVLKQYVMGGARTVARAEEIDRSISGKRGGNTPSAAKTAEEKRRDAEANDKAMAQLDRMLAQMEGEE